ncbi:hypothetical protein PFISCL1PPCAC_6816, partial [Pristionchus fissidentatus]
QILARCFTRAYMVAQYCIHCAKVNKERMREILSGIAYVRINIIPIIRDCESPVLTPFTSWEKLQTDYVNWEWKQHMNLDWHIANSASKSDWTIRGPSDHVWWDKSRFQK